MHSAEVLDEQASTHGYYSSKYEVFEPLFDELNTSCNASNEKERMKFFIDALAVKYTENEVRYLKAEIVRFITEHPLKSAIAIPETSGIM